MTGLQPSLSAIQEGEEIEAMVLGYAIAALASYNDPSEVEVLSWSRLESACLQCPEYVRLYELVHAGAPDDIGVWEDQQLRPYHQHRKHLILAGKVVLLEDRPVIPTSLRTEVMEHLHSFHGGANKMFERAASCLYWPGYRQDINNHRATCHSCDEHAPSNPAQPPIYPPIPLYPFHSVCADFLTVKGRNYLGIVDRYSQWLSVFQLKSDTTYHIIETLRMYWSCFGVSEHLTTDGASVFISEEMNVFLHRWGVTHRVSSAYHARANKCAEVGVKSVKRIIRDNLRQD